MTVINKLKAIYLKSGEAETKNPLPDLYNKLVEEQNTIKTLRKMLIKPKGKEAEV